jgi:hypothetical protein
VRQALNRRRYAFTQTFKGPYSDEVLKDLARFCRAHESTHDANERDSLVFEGRRQVWLRLQEHLRLTPDQLWELYSGRPANED